MQREIAASAARVWAVLGEGFGDIAWASGITTSSLDGELGAGAVRTCHFPPNRLSRAGAVTERLLTFDREARALSYEATDVPGIMKRAVNRWSITPRGPGRCHIQSRATLELRGLAVLLTPLVRPMVRRMGTRFIDELARQACRPAPERTHHPPRPSER